MANAFSDDQKETIIELVKKRPVLYRKREGQFKDTRTRTVKANNWKAVLEKFTDRYTELAGKVRGVPIYFVA